MFLKLLGSCLIVLVCSYMGFRLALRCSQRPQQIAQIISCLLVLKSYITYAQLPLYEAIARCSHGITGKVEELFQSWAGILKNNSFITPEEAIIIALDKMGNQLSLEKVDRDLLHYLGANLGLLNREEQEKHLEMIKAQFEKLEQDAVRVRTLNTKMYRYLGVCGGLAIVILLL